VEACAEHVSQRAALQCPNSAHISQRVRLAHHEEAASIAEVGVCLHFLVAVLVYLREHLPEYR
jgi:hypothetical protein